MLISIKNYYMCRKKLKVTYPAKIQKIVDYLKKNEQLKEIEELSEEILEELKRDDFIEVFVNVRSSKMQQMVESLNKVSDMMISLKSLIGYDESDKEILGQMQEISDMKEKIDAGTIQVVFNPDGQVSISLIAQMEKRMFSRFDRKNK